MRSNSGNTPPRHEDFLTRIGVGRAAKSEKFWRRAERQFGKVASDLMESMHRRANGISDEDFWELKNQNLDLSLALSAQFMGDFYRSYLPWLSASTANSEITRILDVGCDNGVLACCYAERFPNAKVIGIDQSSAGIGCAIELASRLGIVNAEFRAVSALDLAAVLAGKQFDLITATMTYHSVSEIPDMPSGWSLFDIELPGNTKWQAALSCLAPLLGVNGKFISAERLTSSAGALWWAATLARANLHVDWASSEVLCYRSVDGAERVPVFICDRQPRSVDRLGWNVLAFQARSDLTDLAKTPFEGDIAESLFEAVQDRALIWGLEIGSANGVVERFEVWDARTVILAYTYSNRGGRRLIIGPYHKQQECIEHAKRYWECRPHTQLRHYASIAERDATDDSRA